MGRRTDPPQNVYTSVNSYTQEDIMRTNIDIDDDLLAAAQAATGAQTKKDVVHLGLEALVRLSRQAKARELRGSVAWDGDLDAARRDSA